MHGWLSFLTSVFFSLWSVKGSEGQRGPTGTRVSLTLNRNCLVNYNKNILIIISHLWFCTFQGEKGDRGAAGDKV